MRFNRLLLVFSLALVLPALSVAGTSPTEEKDKNPMVTVDTNLGSFTIELYEKEAPITVENFLNYTDKKFYDGTIFHRVIPNFMIQGGGFTPEMVKKATGPPIKNEAQNGLKNLKGTVAMARTGEVHSATSQFFINVKDNPFLDHGTRDFGYAVFGKVVDGWDVVEKIRNVETGTKKGFDDVPQKTVLIKSILRIAEEKEKSNKEKKEAEEE